MALSSKAPQRRRAFLRALASTGNVTLAAEKAQASRYWLYQLRSTDPGFADEWAQALAAAKAALGTTRHSRPPRGKRHVDGAATVITRNKKRQPQIARAHRGKWTDKAEADFLAYLAATANVTEACRHVGFARHSVYQRRMQWPAFREAWDAALESGYARVEMALVMNAGAFLDPVAIDTDYPMPDMTVDQAINLLKLHRAAVHGGRPQRYGHRRKPVDVEALKAEIVRKARLLTGKDAG